MKKKLLIILLTKYINELEFEINKIMDDLPEDLKEEKINKIIDCPYLHSDLLVSLKHFLSEMKYDLNVLKSKEIGIGVL
jgi:hypothetical protein